MGSSATESHLASHSEESPATLEVILQRGQLQTSYLVEISGLHVGERLCYNFCTVLSFVKTMHHYTQNSALDVCLFSAEKKDK